MKLLKADTVESAKNKMDEHFENLKLGTEEIDTIGALGRILAEDIYSPVDLPEFNRSTVDGYAVLTKDTFGASESLPTFLELVGESQMGQSIDIEISSGQTVYVPTGGMIPRGADGMVMLEYTEKLDETTIVMNTSIAPLDGVIKKSEDIAKGELLLKQGRKIRPQDIGALAGLGIAKIKAYLKPRIAIISTGDEIADPFMSIEFGQIRDINTYALSAMSTEKGLDISHSAIIKDDFDLLKNEVSQAIINSDIVIISGGSSVGAKDVTANVIDALGDPGVFVHGVAIKPGKPTIIGRIKDTAVFGLPGHPVSAIMIYKVFVEYLIDKLNDVDNSHSHIDVVAASAANIHSAPGRETYQMVSVEENDKEYVFTPVYGKAGAITLLTKAHGYIKVPGNKEGILKGEKAKVRLL
jgi:molybdopterin molybdotransferase